MWRAPPGRPQITPYSAARLAAACRVDTPNRALMRCQRESIDIGVVFSRAARDVAADGRGRVRGLDARAVAVIRIDALWLAVQPLDMRAGTEAALARVVSVFGEARPHHAYLFANRRANRMKVLVHDGIGVWLAARRLNAGKFVWPRDGAATAPLTRPQFDALVLGLPWQRIGQAGVIRVL
jgi:hypothetical protein